ncbi:MAG: Crp/Fnr family transcriptional regulator [Clostridia bacterium]|nr:Crp/Fnr family transcriptional regulator [Clostridia bacterium]
MVSDFDVSIFFNSFYSKCCKVSKRAFARGETITTYVEKRNQMCILLSGEADLIRYDFNGNKTIIGHFTDNDIFGEAFYPANTNNELFVIAKKDCEVLFFIYNDILKKCKSNCTFHNELSSKLHFLIMNQIISLNTRIELLTKKNIRDKLLSYFDLISSKKLSKSFSIPFSLTDLADYLSVDRSAMMRELSHLKEEGFIEKKGHKIKLLY